MRWSKSLLKSPTWFAIACQCALGSIMMALAVLDATRFADQVAAHGDELMTVGLAAVGGLAFGSAAGMIRHRAAARAGFGTSGLGA